MHEIGIVRSMCKTVLDYAKANNVQHVSEIVCQIGELSMVIPQYVEELYPVVVKDTELADCKLVIETVPGIAECQECDEIFNVVQCEGYCPNCGSFEKDILSGQDFNIKEIHTPE
jgi:hydrogenase nickel incorporation protein HypA/HybF